MNNIEIKPKYIFTHQLVINITYYIITLFLIFSVFFRNSRKMSANIHPLTYLIFFIIVTPVFIIKIVVDYFKINKIVYKITDKGIEYNYQLFSTVKKEVKYDSIEEVTIKVNPIDKIFNIGSIKISTNVNNSSSGLTLICLNNVEEVYNIIKKQMNDRNSHIE